MRSAFIALGLACLAIVDALAAAPQLGTQAPGFYRIMVGDFEVTALSDGVFDIQTKEVLTNTSARSEQLLSRSFHQSVVPTSLNAYLVNTGERLVLVDTGAAKLFGPTLGKLLANLAASGYRPDQIDTILITHMHPDHVGGLVAEGGLVFPNATVYVDQHDVDYWLSASEQQNAPASKKPFFQAAMMTVGKYSSAGKLKTINGPGPLIPGVSVDLAPGHTPGHSSFSFESKGEKLVVWGDLTEIGSVQFAEPTVTMTFDENPAESVRARRRAYANASRGRYLVAGAHLPFPGLGRVRAEGSAYAWEPLDYRSVP